MKTSRGSKLIDKKFLGNVLLVSGVVLSFLLFCGFVGVTELLNKEAFAQGVFIDDVNVSGLSLPEGKELLQSKTEQKLSDIQVALNYNGDIQLLDADDMGISYNIEDSLNQAYEYNKNQNDSVEQRFDKTSYLSGGINFYSEMSIDKVRLHSAIEHYASLFNQSPVDAAASFDKTTSEFTYSPEQPGISIDTDQIYNDILSAINDKSIPQIQVVSEVVPPAITIEELRRNTTLIASFETAADNNVNRNTNIALISSAVDGMEIKPGETLSLNGITGERTEEKGYLPASAISDGILVDQVGGGICQLAGTLYNAALLANLEIIERVRHTWPSVYLPVGLDSTLNWDNKDLKIRNTADYSIFISAKFKDQKLTVRLYGPPLPDGMSIAVKNEIIKEIQPGPTEFRYSNELPVGSAQTVRKARTGYKVKVYRIYYQNGIEVERELISDDYYPALNKIVLKGRHNSQDK